EAFVQAFVSSLPTGKINTFGHHTEPDAVLVKLRSTRPMSCVAAFEDPVRSDGGGHLREASDRLAAYAADIERAYGDPETTATWVLRVGPATQKLAELGTEAATLRELADAVGRAVAERLEKPACAATAPVCSPSAWPAPCSPGGPPPASPAAPPSPPRPRAVSSACSPQPPASNAVTMPASPPWPPSGSASASPNPAPASATSTPPTTPSPVRPSRPAPGSTSPTPSSSLPSRATLPSSPACATPCAPRWPRRTSAAARARPPNPSISVCTRRPGSKTSWRASRGRRPPGIAGVTGRRSP